MTLTEWTDRNAVDEANINLRLAELSALLSALVGNAWIVGQMEWFATSTLPSGWLACDGAAVLRSTYPELFEAIGTTWGAGDGSTTFNLPDARGRASVGAGTGSGLTARSLAQSFGAETHQLTEAEMTAHTHGAAGLPVVGRAAGSGVFVPTSTSASGSAGNNQAHNNMQPSIVFQLAIRVTP